MKKKYLPSLLLIVALAFTQCDDEGSFFSLTQPDPLAKSPLNFWKTESDAVFALNAIYSVAQNIVRGEGENVISNSGSDDLEMNDFGDRNFLAVHQHIQTASNGWLSGYWGACYEISYRANYFLENIDRVSEIDETLKNRLIGEAKFLRGYAYFYLVNLFENVPLVLSVPANSDEYFPSQEEPSVVWAQVESDLKDAINTLPDSYDDSNLGRVTKAAASTLLGKAYLYQEKWDDAALELKKIIDGNYGAYSLVSDFSQNFDELNEFNPESIWEVTAETESGQGLNNLMANTYGYPGGGYADRTMYIPSTWFFNLFKEEKQPDGSYDKRLTATFYFKDSLNPGPYVYGTDTINESDIYLRKYCDFEEIPVSGLAQNNFRVMRYADVLLMYAEAKTEANELDSDAFAALNAIRKRAGLDEKKGLTQAELRTEIRKQRAFEFVLEGSRLADLKRWGVLEEYLKVAYPTDDTRWGYITAYKYVWPIPQGEINLNENLNQNPGY